MFKYNILHLYSTRKTLVLQQIFKDIHNILLVQVHPTTTFTFFFMPLAVIVIVALPALSAFIFPSFVTLTTFLLFEAYLSIIYV